MPNIQLLTELANAQGAAYVNGSKLPWTAARPKDYCFVSLMLQGREMSDMTSFTSGSVIRTQFDPQVFSSQFAPKRHGEDHKRGGSSSMDFMETPLVEYEWNTGILRHDIEFQGGNPFDGGSGSQQFYNILEKREKDFRLDPLDKMEKELSATPDADMFTPDATNTQKLKSIFTGINEWTTAHGVSAEGLFPGMPNQQGLNPAETRFQRVDGFGGSQLACHKVTYDGSLMGTASTNAGHFFDRLQYFIDTLGWEPAPMAGEWQEGVEVRPSYFLCSHEAKVEIQRTNRAHGELFAILNPYRDPAQSEAMFSGIPLKAATSIRNAAVYPAVNAGAAAINAVDFDPVTEFDSDGIVGPRLYAVDPRTVRLRMAPWRAWEEGPWETMQPINRDEMRKVGAFIGNVHFESFVTNGIFSPSVAVSGYAKIAG